MRADDVVIYDPGLGSEQTVFPLNSHSWYALEQGSKSQLPSRSAQFPTVKSPSQVCVALRREHGAEHY